MSIDKNIIDTPMFKVKHEDKIYELNEYSLRNVRLIVAMGDITDVYYYNIDLEWELIEPDGGFSTDIWCSVEDGLHICTNLKFDLVRLKNRPRR